ncbi:MAG: hypothetical protein WC735_04965 [Candidatus Paceibacterota bacterium]|jgi:hypothetical protein
MAKIKSNAEEQRKAEHRRFLARQRPKPVLADRIKAKEEKRMRDGSEKFNSSDFD